MRAGDAGDSAFFVLGGRAVAGLAREGESQRTLSTMTAGDIFGEIAALTGSTRTADVVAEEPSTLLEVPADTLRLLMGVPEFSQLVQGKMTERLARTASLADLPRFGGIDQGALRRLRAEVAASSASDAGRRGLTRISPRFALGRSTELADRPRLARRSNRSSATLPGCRHDALRSATAPRCSAAGRSTARSSNASSCSAAGPCRPSRSSSSWSGMQAQVPADPYIALWSRIRRVPPGGALRPDRDATGRPRHGHDAHDDPPPDHGRLARPAAGPAARRGTRLLDRESVRPTAGRARHRGGRGGRARTPRREAADHRRARQAAPRPLAGP